MKITVGARSSNLSKAQCEEVLSLLHHVHPDIEFVPTYLETTGDVDLITSLRTLGQTDFFTKEIDERQLKGEFRISIHSAKDLPMPLKKGLKIVALTKCLDCRDALVMRDGFSLESLPRGAKIATSSLRREECIKKLRTDFEFVDIRGTIEKRLQALNERLVDGVVIAEAALLRLNLGFYNRILLDCETVPLQGQLAVLARDDDLEMEKLFSSIDTSKKKIYFGLEPDDLSYYHFPVIKTVPIHLEKEIFSQVESATHIIITSKMGARYFMQQVSEHKLDLTLIYQKEFLSVGCVTTATLKSMGCVNVRQAENESQEGLIDLIKEHYPNPKTYSIFFPHSKKSRRNLPDFLKESGYHFSECILYDTVVNDSHKNLPDLNNFSVLFFSSPSCVDAFLTLFGKLPRNKVIKTQGEITQSYLQKL